MNPGMNENAGLNLPPPMPEQNPTGGAPEAGFAAPEQAPAAPEMAPQTAAQAPLAAAPPMPAQDFVAGQTVAPATTNDGVQTVVPVAIDDSDLIEKEWVEKAKQIVENNRHDPYKQSEEMTVFRADYMQKRYNKTIKVSK